MIGHGKTPVAVVYGDVFTGDEMRRDMGMTAYKATGFFASYPLVRQNIINS